jgi:large repetitive protein
MALLIAAISVTIVPMAAAQGPCTLPPASVVDPFWFARNPVEIKWNPVPGASLYAVYVINAATRELVVNEVVTSGTSSVSRLPPGPYATIVYATAPGCTSSQSAPTLFIVDHRSWHQASLLQDGRVLASGGSGISFTGGHRNLSSAEVFDPATLAWQPAPFMLSARGSHTATTLNDGRVLAAGGATSSELEPTTASAEVYTPQTGQWTPVLPMSVPRERHSATLLADGRVLVAGGAASTPGPGPLVTHSTAEVFDPATGSWTPTGPMAVARRRHTATPLADGRVLVAGGETTTGVLSSAEVYDPATNQWFTVGPLSDVRREHTASALHDGRVLVAGGLARSFIRADAEVFDPVTATWSPAGHLTFGMQVTRHAAVVLNDGRVMVIGGEMQTGTMAWVHVYDPATNSWSLGPSLTIEREMHTATLLSDGRVLVTGGQGARGTPTGIEIFDPATNAWTYVPAPWTVAPAP